MNDDGDETPQADHERGGREDLGGLLAAVAHGDQAAFGLVYRQLWGPVSGVVRAVTRAPALVEEVAQEALLEIWRTAARYDPRKGTAMSWALMIARRRAIDRVRADAAASRRERRMTPNPGRQDPVADAVEETLDREQLLISLQKLSDAQRTVIILAFFGRHTYVEVAGLLEIPVGTAKTRIRDALAKLRDLMQATRLPGGDE